MIIETGPTNQVATYFNFKMFFFIKDTQKDWCMCGRHARVSENERVSTGEPIAHDTTSNTHP